MLVSPKAGAGKATVTYGSGLSARFPTAPVLLDELQDLIGRHVPRDHDRRVLWPVPPLEEHLRVRILVRHVLDVGYESHRRVLVGMRAVIRVSLYLQQFLNGIGAVLVVLAENRARLSLEVCFRVREVLERVSIERDDLLQMLFRKRRVILRVVVARACVVARAGLAHDLAILLRWIGRCATEHQVFEEVRETGFAGLHFVSRSGLHGNLHADQIGKAGGHDDDLEAVGQGTFRCCERKHVSRRGAWRLARRAYREPGKEEDSGGYLQRWHGLLPGKRCSTIIHRTKRRVGVIRHCWTHYWRLGVVPAATQC